MVIKVEQCAKFEAIPSIMHGTPQSDPFNQFKIGQEWRVGCRKIPRLPGLMDHFSAPLYSDVVMSTMGSQITGILIVYSTVCSGVLIVYSTVCSGRSKKTPKIRVTGLCEGNSPVTGEFPAVIPPNPVLVFGWHIHLLGFFFSRAEKWKVALKVYADKLTHMRVCGRHFQDHHFKNLSNPWVSMNNICMLLLWIVMVVVGIVKTHEDVSHVARD